MPRGWVIGDQVKKQANLFRIDCASFSRLTSGFLIRDITYLTS